MTDRSILLVEDTASLSHAYGALLRKAGHEVDHAFTAEEARARFAGGAHPVVLLDLMLPDGDGVDVLRAMRDRDPGVRAIVMTANGSINRAVEAMRTGAFDFLTKPFDEDRLLTAVSAAFASVGRPDEAPPAGEDREGRFHGMIGSSAVMREIYDTLRQIGRSSATVFITGESGAGKELCARAIHALSPRRTKPFVTLNCGAIARDQFDSELFGHLRGAFAGAVADRPGAAEAADGGTLFLDEVCELHPDLQTRLARFLQTSQIHPVGAAAPRKVDLRILCASDLDPRAEVEAGRFRADLYYRLHVVPIDLPPLRARGRDVIEIAETLLARYARAEGRRFRRLSPDAARALTAYSWPGNVRELQNTLRSVVVLHDGEEVTAGMLPARVTSAEAERASPEAPAAAAGGTFRDRLRGFVGAPLERLEREFIEATIAACDGSIPRAARLLEVSPSTLYRKRENWARSAD